MFETMSQLCCVFSVDVSAVNIVPLSIPLPSDSDIDDQIDQRVKDEDKRERNLEYTRQDDNEEEERQLMKKQIQQAKERRMQQQRVTRELELNEQIAEEEDIEAEQVDSHSAIIDLRPITNDDENSQAIEMTSASFLSSSAIPAKPHRPVRIVQTPPAIVDWEEEDSL